MPEKLSSLPRVFKASWFAKAARKAGISDAALCELAKQISSGQVDDLGGGVYKVRVNKNLHRVILLAKVSRVWVFQYLFAKSDRANIAVDELVQFRELAKAYAKLTDVQLQTLIDEKEFVEICHGN